MTNVDVPYLAHTENMASQPKPPTYDPSADQIHNHYYQTSNDEPSRQPWYRRRGCVLMILLVVTILIILAVVVTVAVVVVLRNHHHGDVNDTPPVESGANMSRTSSDLPVSTPLWQSVVTVTMMASETSEAAETETTILTITASAEEDLGEVLSSILTEFPLLMTEVVTVSVTEQPSTLALTSSETTSSTSTSTSITTSTTSATPTSTSTSSTSSPSTSSSTSTSTTSAPPSLSTDSNLAAVNVDSRHLLVWQDHDSNLIAFDSGTSTPAQVYNIADTLNDKISPKHATPLTAAADDTGAVHLFYIDNEDGMIGHLVQREAGSWTTQSKTMHPLSSSSLSATWHQSSNGNSSSSSSSSGEISVAFQGTKGEILLYSGADQAASDKASIVNVSELLHLEIGDWNLVGLAVASGTMLSGSDPGLYFLIEGKDEVLTAECSIGFERNGELESDCWWSTAFTDQAGDPIEIESHPTHLSWSVGTGNDGTPMIQGFLTLDSQGSRLEDHRLVPEEHSVVAPYRVGGGSIEAIAMAGGETLFGRFGGKLWEFYFDRDARTWDTLGEVDTRLSGF